jgi:hypothetical protein
LSPIVTNETIICTIVYQKIRLKLKGNGGTNYIQYILPYLYLHYQNYGHITKSPHFSII